MLFFARRILIQLIDELGGFRRSAVPLGDDVAIIHFLAVDDRVIVYILPQGSSLERDTYEQTLRARPRQNVGMHLRIGLRRGSASNGACCDRGFAAQRELARK